MSGKIVRWHSMMILGIGRENGELLWRPLMIRICTNDTFFCLPRTIMTSMYLTALHWSITCSLARLVTLLSMWMKKSTTATTCWQMEYIHSEIALFKASTSSVKRNANTLLKVKRRHAKMLSVASECCKQVLVSFGIYVANEAWKRFLTSCLHVAFSTIWFQHMRICNWIGACHLKLLWMI